MPDKHRYIMVSCKDEKIYKNLKTVFNGYFFVVRVEHEYEIIDHLDTYEKQIASIIIDDSIGVQKAIHFFELYHHRGGIGVPLFLLDGTIDDTFYNKAISLGVDLVIRKPYDIKVMRERVLELTNFYKDKHRLQWVIDQQTKELKESVQVLNAMKLEVLESLGTLVEFRNLESGEHVYRVRFLTDILAKELQRLYPEYGISDMMRSEITMAAILHDVGKISISDSILNKPGPLTDLEFEEMKKHTIYGCKILKQFKGLYTQDTYHFYYDVIYYHHEKWDGNGYPNGLKGDEIPIWAQVVSLADVYDALTNERVYKKAYSHESAVEMIFNGECGVFNPKLLKCFQNIENQLHTINKKISKIPDHISYLDKSDQQNLVLNGLEKERSYHRAYTELVSDSFFEFDSQYHKLQHFNMLGRAGEEIYTTEMFDKIHPEDVDEFRRVLDLATAKHPTVRVVIRIRDEFAIQGYRKYLVVIRTTWDIYTNQRIGGVGKIEILDSSEN